MKNIQSALVVMVVLAFLIALVGCSSTLQKDAQGSSGGLTGSSIASGLSQMSQSAVAARWSGFIPSPCSKLSDDFWPTKSLSSKCFASTSSTRKLRIVNDLQEVTRDGTTYKNQVLHVLKYNDVMTVSGDLNAIIAAGTELLQPGTEPVTAVYPEIISPSSDQEDFTISGTGTVTYDLGIMIGQWDPYGTSSSQWVRNMQGVIQCNGNVVNKMRFFHVTHPAGKRVTIRLSSLFPNYSFPEEGYYCPLSGSSSGSGGFAGSGAS